MSIYGQLSIEKIREHMNELYNYLKTFSFTCENRRCNQRMLLTKDKGVIRNGLYHIKCPFCNNLTLAEDKLKEIFIFDNLMHDGNEDFDINFKEDYYIQIDRVTIHNKNNLINKSDECSIGEENHHRQRIEPFPNEKINSMICLDNDIFVVSSTNIIRVIRLNGGNVNILLTKRIVNENSLTLCNLNYRNSIAIGGKNLLIYRMNTMLNEFLEPPKKFNQNRKINKIILLNGLNEVIIKRFATCDQEGFVNIYNIRNGDNISTNIFSSFNKECHQHSINCILYVPNEEIFVSGSNQDREVKFWEIKENDLIIMEVFANISFTIYNESFLNINKFILIGDKDGIRVYKIVINNQLRKRIEYSFYYKNEEFGIVYSIKSLGSLTREPPSRTIGKNYFICGRSFGFCSIFLLREKEKSIRKINIFRNNNQSSSEHGFNVIRDDFCINNICVEEMTYENDPRNPIAFGRLLVYSVDKTLKIYNFKYFENVHYS